MRCRSLDDSIAVVPGQGYSSGPRARALAWDASDPAEATWSEIEIAVSQERWESGLGFCQGGHVWQNRLPSNLAKQEIFETRDTQNISCPVKRFRSFRSPDASPHDFSETGWFNGHPRWDCLRFFVALSSFGWTWQEVQKRAEETLGSGSRPVPDWGGGWNDQWFKNSSRKRANWKTSRVQGSSFSSRLFVGRCFLEMVSIIFASWFNKRLDSKSTIGAEMSRGLFWALLSGIPSRLLLEMSGFNWKQCYLFECSTPAHLLDKKCLRSFAACSQV